MNNIAKAKENDVLDYICNGLVNSPDTIAGRFKQLQGLEVFRKSISLQTADIMKSNDYQEIYKNSFSRCRSRFDEYGRISLTSKERK